MAFFTAAQVAALSESTVYLDLVTEMRFASETGYYWNGNTEMVSGGHTYLPMYGYGSIELPGLSSQSVSDQAVFRFNGLPGQNDSLLAQVIGDTAEVDQRMVIVSIQLLNKDGAQAWQPAFDPIPLWWGLMQPPRVERTGMQGIEGAVQSVTLTAENAFFNRARPPFGRLTDRDQQQRSPGDKFCQHIASLLFKSFTYPDYVILAAAGLSAIMAASGIAGVGQGIV